MANDEHVVRFLGGDVNADARQRRYDTADVVAAEEHDARIVVPYQSLDVIGELALRGKLADSFEFERCRWCKYLYLFPKTRDDRVDIVRFVLIDPPLLSRVLFSLRDDDDGRDLFVECGAVLDGPDEGSFREFRSIERDDERRTFDLYASVNNSGGGYGWSKREPTPVAVDESVTIRPSVGRGLSIRVPVQCGGRAP